MGNCAGQANNVQKPPKFRLPEFLNALRSTPNNTERDEFIRWGSNHSTSSKVSSEIDSTNLKTPWEVESKQENIKPIIRVTDSDCVVRNDINSTLGKALSLFDDRRTEPTSTDAMIVLKLDGLPAVAEEEVNDPVKRTLMKLPVTLTQDRYSSEVKVTPLRTHNAPERFSAPVLPIKDVNSSFNAQESESDDSGESVKGELYMKTEKKEYEVDELNFQLPNPPCLNITLHEETEFSPGSMSLYVDEANSFPSLSFDINITDDDGGGYLGTFDRGVTGATSIGGVYSPSIVGFSGGSEPELYSVNSFSSNGMMGMRDSQTTLHIDNEKSKQDARGHVEKQARRTLSISLGSDLAKLVRESSDGSPGIGSWKVEDSNVTVIVDFQNQGPPVADSISSHSKLITQPRFPQLSLSCIDLNDCSDSQSDVFVSGGASPETPVVLKNNVKKPKSSRCLGLQSIFSQDEHYRNALIDSWPTSSEIGMVNNDSESFPPEVILDNIIDHVLVEEEKWENMFGVYSSTIGMHRGWIQAIDFDPVSNHVVSGGTDNSVYVWDSTKEHSEKVSLPKRALQASDVVCSVLFSDPELIVIGTQSEMIIWNWEENPKKYVNYFERGGVTCLCKVPNQRDQFVAGQEGGELCIWNVNRHDPVLTLDGHSKFVSGVSPIANGQVLLSSSRDSTLKFWDQRTGDNVTTFQAAIDFKQLKWVNGVCALNDWTIATARADNTINIWDRRKNLLTACIATLTGHGNYVWDVKTVGSDGLISASSDCKLKLWDWKRGSVKQNLKGSGSTVFALATDGEYNLYSAGIDHYVRNWTLWI